MISVQIHELALVADSLSTEVYIQVSPEGEEILRYVRQPRQQQAPVSYKTIFSGAYIPNSMPHLPVSLRTQLQNLGRPATPAIADAPEFAAIPDKMLKFSLYHSPHRLQKWNCNTSHTSLFL